MTAPVQFDPRPLQAPIDPIALRAFARSGLAPRGASIGFAAAAVAFIAVGGLMLIFTLPSIALRSGRPGETIAGPLSTLFLVPLAVAIVVGVLVGIFGGRHRLERAYRLATFAAANHMTYQPHLTAPGYPGMLFSVGSKRRATDVVRGTAPRPIEFANYQYTVQRGENSSKTYRWRYVAVRHGNMLPHIVLDATANNGMFGSNLPARFGRGQRLSLEGDFDNFFSLYCPEGYETDALYLFTPDVMVSFMDASSQFDVEIVDDWVFFYSQDVLNPMDPATWAREFNAVQALLRKIAQWERWRDDRRRMQASAGQPYAGPGAAGYVSAGAGMGANAAPPIPMPGMPAHPHNPYQAPRGVAQQGRRLRRSGVTAATIIGIVFAVVFAIVQFSVLR